MTVVMSGVIIVSCDSSVRSRAMITSDRRGTIQISGNSAKNGDEKDIVTRLHDSTKN